MRYWLFACFALFIGANVGCAINACHEGGGCGPMGACDNRCGRTYSGIEGSYAGHHHGYQEAAPQGPAVGAVTYPYYTTRGPRDFLMPNPPPLGP